MMTHPGHPGFSRMTGTATCMICHAPLAVHEVRLGVGNVCRRADCRWRYAVLEQHRQICRICGRPLSLSEKAAGICADADCRRQAVVRQAREGYERRVQQEQQLREQAEPLREQIILDVETLQQYRARHPEQSPRQILSAYLQHIGQETCEGGCVYQGAAGCSLPCALRAHLCNEFYCGGLREFRVAVPATGPVRAFFVAIGGDVIHRAALVDEAQMLVTSAPPPLAD